MVALVLNDPGEKETAAFPQEPNLPTVLPPSNWEQLPAGRIERLTGHSEGGRGDLGHAPGQLSPIEDQPFRSCWLQKGDREPAAYSHFGAEKLT